MDKTKQKLTEPSDRVQPNIRIENLAVDVRYADSVAKNVAANHYIVFRGGRRRPTHND